MGEIVIAWKNVKVCTVLPISQKMKRKIVEQTMSRKSSLPSNNIYAYPSKEQAIREAKKLVCIGIQKMGNLSMPCAIHAFTQ
tara:strand:+ start:157 stop:402 length:246 start_codon:yes stop_codon:yes gene_type:complete